MYGVKSFTAVINPPEGAILAVGAAVDRVVPAGGGFLPRKVLEVTVSADHRAIDGLLAARFLLRLRRLLEDPSRIF
jgi:pyruvate dehydrogenase E2 component (dihydrolipoamide acetyltransferase)